LGTLFVSSVDYTIQAGMTQRISLETDFHYQSTKRGQPCSGELKEDHPKTINQIKPESRGHNNDSI